MVFLRNLKTQNQQKGVTQPWGKSPGQNASKVGKLVPIKLCHLTQELGNYTPKKTSLVWSDVFEKFKNLESIDFFIIFNITGFII